MFAIGYQLANRSFSIRNVFRIYKRYKSQKADRKAISPCKRAINHFDDFYKSIFQTKWPSVRLGLFSEAKTVAVVNNFGHIDEAVEALKASGAYELKLLLDAEETEVNNEENIPVQQEKYDAVINEVVSKKISNEEPVDVYPKDKEVKTKASFVNEETKSVKPSQEFNYNIDEAKTSLKSDLAKAEFDTERLILPDSEGGQSVLYDFVPASQLRGLTEYIPESEYYKFYKTSNIMSINIEEEHELDYPDTLLVYSFERGDCSSFPPPKKVCNDVYSFHQVDGGTLLSVIALGIEPQDSVLDFCSRTGDNALCMFQTLLPSILVGSRTKKIESLFKDYIFEYSPTWNDRLLLTDLSEMDFNIQFDKILVDVPSTNDRYSLFNEEDNIFEPHRIKERLQLPLKQKELLLSALKLVRPGGTVLYTTSTMSPVQNDGVVYAAIERLWEENKTECTIKDMTKALACSTNIFNYGNYLNLKYGTLIVPFVASNFGPKYFCKIVKNEKKEKLIAIADKKKNISPELPLQKSSDKSIPER